LDALEAALRAGGAGTASRIGRTRRKVASSAHPSLTRRWDRIAYGGIAVQAAPHDRHAEVGVERRRQRAEAISSLKRIFAGVRPSDTICWCPAMANLCGSRRWTSDTVCWCPAMACRPPPSPSNPQSPLRNPLTAATRALLRLALASPPPRLRLSPVSPPPLRLLLGGGGGGGGDRSTRAMCKTGRGGGEAAERPTDGKPSRTPHEGGR
jgi:hypothetical protein